MGQRTTHRAPAHRVARHTRALTSAALTAALLATPLIAAPASADTSSQWPLKYLKANQDWTVSKGSGVTVAVLDTGVAKVPDTQMALLPGADFSHGTTTSGDGQTDLDGHGTSIAVMIAGVGTPLTGLAPEAKILPVRDTDLVNGTADDVAAGIEYAVSHHASVINISEAFPSTDAALLKAIQDAEGANIVIVAASGNEGLSSVDIPANAPGVVAVGAVDQTGTVWSKSNTGPQVTLSAPGVKIPTEDDTGAVESGDGTSAATAYVSATAALIRAAHPSWTAGQVIRDLIATADPGPGQTAGSHSDQYGYGIIDPLKALQASAPTDTSNPLLGSTSTAPTSAASSGTNPTATTATSGTTTNTGKSGSSGSALIGGIIVLVVVGIIVLLIVWLTRRNRNRPGGPGGPGGQPPYGGPGAQQPGYGIPPQYPQQYPQPQQNPYPPQPPYPQAQPPFAPPQQYPAPQQQPPYPPQPPQQPQPQPPEQNPHGYR